MIISKIDKTAVKSELSRIIKYQISGIAVVATDWAIYFILNSLFGGFSSNLNFRYTAQLISNTCGAVMSYAVNRKWTFGSDSKFFSRKMLQYLLLVLACLAVSECVLALTSQALSLQGSAFGELAVKILADSCSGVLSYVGIRLWVFREKAA
ncbi:MAG: GtrA family protein [Oscillospiraceae bacterium]|nr:GtrA family protein [Oscillospiraceae bacterium]